jgi:hypothetical protein
MVVVIVDDTDSVVAHAIVMRGIDRTPVIPV